MKSHCRRRAFTLVELLVVISIITLLISILVPSLARARENARTVSCASNLRQLYMGCTYYAADFDDVVLFHNTTGYNSEDPNFWVSGSTPHGIHWVDMLREQKYIPKLPRDAGVPVCVSTLGIGNKAYRGTYITNFNLFNPLATGTPPVQRNVKFSTLPRPGDLFLLGDRRWKGDSSDPTDLNTVNYDTVLTRLGFRHGSNLETPNVAFADGHVELRTMSTAPSGERRLFDPTRP